MTETVDECSSKDSTTSGDYTLQWLDANASDNETRRALLTEEESDQGLASSLFQQCVHALRDFQKEEHEKCPSTSRKDSLRESIGTLRLWGDTFGAGELDKALDQSDELKESVLEQFVNIGRLLLQGMKAG